MEDERSAPKNYDMQHSRDARAAVSVDWSSTRADVTLNTPSGDQHRVKLPQLEGDIAAQARQYSRFLVHEMPTHCRSKIPLPHRRGRAQQRWSCAARPHLCCHAICDDPRPPDLPSLTDYCAGSNFLRSCGVLRPRRRVYQKRASRVRARRPVSGDPLSMSLGNFPSTTRMLLCHSLPPPALCLWRAQEDVAQHHVPAR